MSTVSICQQCGACCAAFRVTFHGSELESQGGRVPDGLADHETGDLYQLRGTDYARPRCAALCGTLGESAAQAVTNGRNDIIHNENGG